MKFRFVRSRIRRKAVFSRLPRHPASSLSMALPQRGRTPVRASTKASSSRDASRSMAGATRSRRDCPSGSFSARAAGTRGSPRRSGAACSRSRGAAGGADDPARLRGEERPAAAAAGAPADGARFEARREAARFQQAQRRGDPRQPRAAPHPRAGSGNARAVRSPPAAARPSVSMALSSSRNPRACMVRPRSARMPGQTRWGTKEMQPGQRAALTRAQEDQLPPLERRRRRPAPTAAGPAGARTAGPRRARG